MWQVGVLTLDTLALEDDENTGIRYYKSVYIKGQNSGASAYITKINWDTNKIFYSGKNEYNYQVGEKIYLVASNYQRGGDYLYIPIIQAGQSEEKPSQSIAPGTMFFDTTLGKPVWYNGEKWVDSEGVDIYNLSI